MSAHTKSIIEDILEKPFSERSYSEKHLIVVNGRPCPKLSNLKSSHKDTKKKLNQQFKESQYSMYPWLCGCENKVKLFCWPCLLFSQAITSWNTGVDNLNSLQTLQKKHQQSIPHLHAVLKLASFGEDRVDQALCTQLKMLNDQHNLQVKRNLGVLKRLVDVICFLNNQDLPFRRDEESATLLNQGNYVELLNLLKRYDPTLEAHFQTGTPFGGTSTTFQHELIQAVGKVLDGHIHTQLGQSEFVAIMLDESSEIDMKSQLSVVFRYCFKGKIYETFVGFIDVSSVNSAEELFQLVKSILEKYDVVQKIVAQTYDGAAVTSVHVKDFQTRLKGLCGKALFVHCYAHNLNSVLSQGLNNIKECKIFFSTLNSMASFTSDCSKKTNSFKEYIKGKITTSLVSTGWCFSSRLVNEVHTYRDSIVEYLDSIQDVDSRWEVNYRMAASGYSKFLESFETIFLLNVFSQLFDSDVLFNILQNENTEIALIVNQINKLDGFLKAQRECFSEIWHRTLQTVLEASVKNRSVRKDQSEPNEAKYKNIYYEIVDNLIMQIADRYSSFEKFKYFDLLNGKHFKEYSHKDKFPEQMLETCTKESHREIFDHYQLKNELMVIYEGESIGRHTTSSQSEAETTNTKIVTPYDVLRYIEIKNIAESFEEVYRLAKLICTIPATTVSDEESFCAIKRIKAYLSGAHGQDRQSFLALLSIEKAMLIELRNNEDFIDRIIKNLSDELRVHFMYK